MKAYYLLSLLALAALVNAAPGYHATRTMPYFVVAGEKIQISLDIDAANITTLGISQANPQGWDITNITCGGYKIRGFLVEWIFWQGGTHTGDLTCTYSLTVPTFARGNYSITGTYFKDGANIWNIDGSTKLYVYAPELRSVIDVIHRWEKDEVTLAQVVYAINAWAKTK
jgi:hypothetical protein